MLSENVAADVVEPVLAKRLLDVREVARVLGCGRTQIYQMITTHELLAIKVGRLTRVPVEVLDEFVARKVREAEGL